MKWTRDDDGDFINLDFATQICIFDKGPDYPERWIVRATLDRDDYVLLKCKEEKTARAYVGRLMKKLGAV